MWGEEVIKTLDLTAKTTNMQSYTGTFNWGEDWSLYGCANNNGQWAYVRFGGKASTSTETKTGASTITAKTAINSPLNEIKISHNGISKSNCTIKSVVLSVASDANYNNIIKTITLNPTLAVATKGTFSFTDIFASNSFYKITINWSVKGTTNCGLDIYTVEFIKETETESVATPTFTPAEGTYTSSQNVTISTATDGATVYYTTDGTEPTTSSSIYSSPINVSQTTTIKAIAVKDGMDDSEVAEASYVIKSDAAALPFNWEGGTSEALLALDGVSANGLGTDYAESNAPYQVKFDTTGDYIQIKTDGQPGKITIDVKMLGGANTSKITVQGSADGESFTDVQELTISGAQNAEITLETANNFAATDRYIRLLFTKGSNVGVGSISIAQPTNDPAINAENVEIEFNTTSGSITYEIVNPVEGGTLSSTTDVDWLNFESTGTAFTTSQNETITARTANVTLTYTYNSTSSVTKQIILTQAGNPNAPGTENNPYTVAQALENTPASGNSADVYISGVVKRFYGEDILSDGSNFRYYISDEDEDNELLVYKGKGLNNADFEDAGDLLIGDKVKILGKLTTFNSTKEIASGNYIVSLIRPEQPKHVVSFSINGTETTLEVEEYADIIFPTATPSIEGKTFVGWTTAAIDGETDEAPSFVTSATMGTADVTYYAVYATQEGEGSMTTVTDELTRETTGVTGTNYTEWSDKTATSVAVYAGQSAGGNDAIQLRSTNSNSGIVTTASGGKATKVAVIWNSNTAAVRTLNIYGSNTAYTTATELYNSSNQGTLLGTIENGTSTELTITGDYTYIGIRSASGAMYLSSISITWENGSPATYSGYCTTVSQPEPVSVTISAAGYSTLYYGTKNLTVPEGMEAYTVKVTTQVERSTTYNAGDVIPAGTGVVLKAEAGTYEFSVAAEAGAQDANNMLRGNDEKATTTGGTYYYALTLDKNKQNPGFYWMVENGGAYQAGAHKAYLALDKTFAELAEGSETGVKGFLALPGDGIVTGIDNMNVGAHAEIYNLAGQRVQKMQKGIYVVGGKKVMVK